jgi:alpha-tubulin suppressor-like RCC1 family protein
LKRVNRLRIPSVFLALATLSLACTSARNALVMPDGGDGGVDRPGDGPLGGLDAADGSSRADGGSDAVVGCAGGTHNCSGLGCVSNNSVDHCGGMCSACVQPAGGTATCAADAGVCDFTCGSLIKCGGKCVSGCCMDGDCPAQNGKTGQCDTSTNTCSYQSCAAGFKPCGTSCIPTAQCCAASDCAVCQSCVAGACVAVKSQDDPVATRCAGTCDAAGACKSKQGQSCNTVAAGCVSGTTCSPDGYCCDSACSGSCVACDLAGHVGACTNVPAGAAPHANHASCAGLGTSCAGSCNGAGACGYPTGSCGNGPSCSGANLVAQSTCSNGSCVTPAPASCAGGLVCSGSACETLCTTDADCLPSYFCEGNSCHLDAVQVSCGSEFTCALLVDGSVRCWGRNQFGQLGLNGPATFTSVPVAVPGLAGAAKSISSTDAEHTCALLTNGSVNCWGSDFEGELGNNTPMTADFSATPFNVGGLPGPASAIAVNGDEFSCAVMASDGSIWCWGDNIWGELGNGTSGGSAPFPVQALALTGATAIGGGESFMCSLALGGVYCWGEDTNGQLGNGTLPSNGMVTRPGSVFGLGGGTTPLMVAGGAFHACAVVAGGTVYCWGWNSDGQLGTTAVPIGSNGTSAVAVQGLPTGAKAVAPGGYHTCAVLTNGSVWCWGRESPGQLGNGATMAPNGDAFTATPVQVIGLPAGVPATAVSAALYQTCALLANGSVWCWGQGNFGELGNSSSNSSTPLEVVGW